jgi:cell wall-associated NlpC family hydrolase
MKNFKSLLLACALFVYGTAISQVSVNSVSTPKAKELKFIDDISFTPEGITQIESTPSEKRVGVTDLIAQVPDLTSKLPQPSVEIIESCSKVQFKYATLLNVPVEYISATTTNIFNVIEEWWGTKYRLGGTSKNGIDCSAFTSVLLMGCYALSTPRTAREQHKAATPVSRHELTEGDLVFFNTRGGVSHVGVYIMNDYFVHSSSSQGVTISNLNDSYYAKRFISGGRIEASVQGTAKL